MIVSNNKIIAIMHHLMSMKDIISYVNESHNSYIKAFVFVDFISVTIMYVLETSSCVFGKLCVL